MVWTVESVKRNLPDVTVNDNGRTFTAQLSGRLHAFATLTWQGRHGDARRAPVAWLTIVNVLNSGDHVRA